MDPVYPQLIVDLLITATLDHASHDLYPVALQLKMKWLLISLMLVLTIEASSSAPSYNMKDFYAKVTPSVDIVCLVEKCLLPAERCVGNTKCRDALECVKKCFDNWDNDTTSEKFNVQNCTNVCAFSFGDSDYVKFMQCIGDHQCLTLPAIPSQCKADKLKLLKKLPSEILNGSWWVVRGYRPLYDCYPCQHLKFKQINSTYWNYTPTYQVYLAAGTLKVVSDQCVIKNTAPGANISFGYHDLGLYRNETWWLFDMADDKSYVLVYYCGNAFQWYYDGALVLAREKTLTDFEIADVTASFSKAIGLDSTKFCAPQTANCPD